MSSNTSFMLIKPLIVECVLIMSSSTKRRKNVFLAQKRLHSVDIAMLMVNVLSVMMAFIWTWLCQFKLDVMLPIFQTALFLILLTQLNAWNAIVFGISTINLVIYRSSWLKIEHSVFNVKPGHLDVSSANWTKTTSLLNVWLVEVTWFIRLWMRLTAPVRDVLLVRDTHLTPKKTFVLNVMGSITKLGSHVDHVLLMITQILLTAHPVLIRSSLLLMLEMSIQNINADMFFLPTVWN